MEKYGIKCDANTSSFERSAKIMLKKGKTRVTYNGHYINAHIFLTLPRDIKVEALGAAKRRSPYLFEVLRRIPACWIPTLDNADNNRIVVKTKNSSVEGLNEHNSA